jgi:hypothetical protein
MRHLGRSCLCFVLGGKYAEPAKEDTAFGGSRRYLQRGAGHYIMSSGYFGGISRQADLAVRRIAPRLAPFL